MNRECLELEEQTNALKQEVQEAWSSYKQAQEKAILIESDLQDEIKLLTKSKNDDKQQLLVQYNKLKDELAASMQQVTELNNEKDELSKQLLMNNDINSQWATRVTELEELLNDARNNTVQGVQNLRDELRTSQLSLETLRNEHLTLIRQNEKRQSELEQENFSLTKSISSMQKELSYYKNSSANSDRNNDNYNNSNEYISMQQEIVMLSEKLNTETEKLNESERLIKQLQCEVRANQNNFDDERSRAKHLIDDLNNKIAKLEDKNRELKRSHKTFDNKADGYNSTNSMIETVKSTDDIDLETYYALAKEVHELRQQSENLSKMLLKKQGIVNDLQAERSALKSRLLDLQTR